MSMKRIGYIGLVSPDGFDYYHLATPTCNDTKSFSSPNPYYIGSFGMLLLYDELWFLCESLCPENMRKLNYVRFIDQEYTCIDFKEIYAQALDIYSQFTPEQTLFNYLSDSANKAYIGAAIRNNASHQNVVKMIGASTNTIDHCIQISNLLFYFPLCSDSLFNYIFDTLVLDWLYEKTGAHMEFLTPETVGIFTEDLFSKQNNQMTQHCEAIEMLALPKIPDYLTPKGPYHPCVEDARSIPSLIAFREKLLSYGSLTNAKDICELLYNEFISLKNEVFEKALDGKQPWKSLSHTIIGTVSDAVVPYSSLMSGVISGIHATTIARKRRWARFMHETGFTWK